MGDKVVKVYEEGCSVCDTMSRYDRSVFQSFPSLSLIEISFEEVQDYERDPFRQRVYRLLEQYAVSPTYEIDFPTYLFLSEEGKYKGFLQGALELKELREGVKGILGNHSSE